MMNKNSAWPPSRRPSTSATFCNKPTTERRSPATGSLQRQEHKRGVLGICCHRDEPFVLHDYLLGRQQPRPENVGAVQNHSGDPRHTQTPGSADRKSVGLRLPSFESWICHQGQRLSQHDRHRLMLHPDAQLQGISADDRIADIVSRVAVPRVAA